MAGIQSSLVDLLFHDCLNTYTLRCVIFYDDFHTLLISSILVIISVNSERDFRFFSPFGVGEEQRGREFCSLLRTTVSTKTVN